MSPAASINRGIMVSPSLIMRVVIGRIVVEREFEAVSVSRERAISG